MSLDYVQTLNDAFWVLVKPVLPQDLAIIDYTDSGADLKKETTGGPTRIGLVYVTDSNRPSVHTFAMNSPAFVLGTTMDLAMEVGVTFDVEIRTAEAKITTATSLFALVRKAVYAKYPHLGVTSFPVTEFQFNPTRVTRSRGRGGYSYRSPWVVKCRPKASQMVS
jgi:hypothetical protein